MVSRRVARHTEPVTAAMAEPVESRRTKVLPLALGLACVPLFWPPSAWALDPERAVTQYAVSVWLADKDFPSGGLLSLAQTPDRYLWIGTTAGLLRFDGSRFVPVDIGAGRESAGTPANEICVDPTGTIWIRSMYRELIELGGGGARRHEGPLGDPEFVYALGSARGGGVWVVTQRHGLLRVAEGRLATPIDTGFLDPSTVYEDEDGVVWIGTRGRGVLRVEGRQMRRYGVAQGLPSGVVNVVTEDGRGGMWIGTSGGLSRLAGERVETFTVRDGLPRNDVTALVLDRDQNLWVGTQGGLARMQGRRLAALPERVGLADSDVRALLEDHEGNLWVATGSGLTRLSDGVFTTYGRAEGLPGGTVRTMAESHDGGIWIGTQAAGIARLSDGILSPVPGTPFEGRNVLCMFEDRHRHLWVATEDRRLFRMAQGAISDVTPVGEVPPPKYSWISEDEDGLLLASSMRGLGRIVGRRFVPLHPEGPQAYFLYDAFRAPRGDLWLATNHGLMHVVDGHYTIYTLADGLPADRIFALSPDPDGTLWLATQAGLTRFREGEEPASLTQSQGLPSSHIRLLLDDRQGHFWLGTMGHLLRIGRREVEDCLDGKTSGVTPRLYDTSDGLRTTEITLGARPGLRSRDGRLWFATAKGLSVVDPKRSAPAVESPPAVRIEVVSINGVSEKRGEYPPGPGDVAIRFTAVVFRGQTKLAFRYRLEGLSDRWVGPATERVARFSNLRPGAYTLHVVVEDLGRSWPAQEGSFAFVLRPHWYQTRPWYGFLALVIAVGMFGLYSWRVRSYRARHQALERSVVARTEELRQEIQERQKAQGELRQLNEELGARVAARTSELAATNQALAAETERLAVTLRSIGDGVIATDVAGRVVLMNRAAERVCGWSTAEAEGRPLPEVFRIVARSTRQPLPDPACTVLERGVVVQQPVDALLLTPSGSEVPVADSAAPIRDRDSNIVGVVVVFRDVTEKLRVEERLRNAERLEALSALAGGIAHDFNNLLSGIFGYIEMAQRRTSDDSQAGVTLALDRCLSVLKRARGLTSQLLTFSRAEQPVTAPLALERLLRDGVGFALSGSNVSADLQIAGDLWLCEADARQIDQAIDNLLLNARQAMPAGGTITVLADNVTVPGDFAAPLPEGRYVRLVVRDEGPGVPEELHGRIFEPFFTTKPTGTGLGLATTSSIVRRHKGHVGVESTLGAGAAFTILLPASASEAAPEPDAGPQFVAGRGRVLLLDDEDYVREVVSEALTSLGYEVTSVGRGEEAVERFREAHGTPHQFDVALLDLTIPGSMGGVATLRELRKIDEGIRAIASSGYSTDPTLADPAEFGFDASLAKPHTTAELAAALTRVLG